MGSHKKRSVGGIIKGTFANIGRVIAALIMVGIITGCIVASVLTVYVLRYINSDEQLSLDDITLKYTTIIYADSPETGEPYEIQRLQTAENRIWVPYDQIPKHMVDALIAIEDKRFMEHQGVDWKRTFGAFINLFVPFTIPSRAVPPSPSSSSRT
jgi:penicillin-binding protein 1A